MKIIKPQNFLLLIILFLLSACHNDDSCPSLIDSDFSYDLKSSTLVDVIKYYQDIHVKTSYDDWNSFTWVDLDNFHNKNVVDNIVFDFETSCVFSELINYLIKLSESEQNGILYQGLKTYQPTWAQQGKISTTGQTDAGQAAQKEIAKAIVNLVKDYLLT